MLASMRLADPPLKLVLPAVVAEHGDADAAPRPAIDRPTAAREAVRLVVVLAVWGLVLAFANDIGRLLLALIR
jgi:hypothetical protein